MWKSFPLIIHWNSGLHADKYQWNVFWQTSFIDWQEIILSRQNPLKLTFNAFFCTSLCEAYWQENLPWCLSHLFLSDTRKPLLLSSPGIAINEDKLIIAAGPSLDLAWVINRAGRACFVMRTWHYEHIGCQQHTPYCSRLSNLHLGNGYGLLRGLIWGCDPAQQVTALMFLYQV